MGRADLNGCEGFIESATEDKGRYTIKVPPIAATTHCRLLPSCLPHPTPDPRPSPRPDPRAEPALNPDPRQVQQMGKKDEWLSLKPTNAALPPPTRVRLTGLVQASQYNGRIVKIVRTDLEAGRYEVTMFEDEDTKRVQKALRLKFENALLW